MYTGIIHEQGAVATVTLIADGGLRVTISAAEALTKSIREGSSVNVAGICLTARDISTNGFSADVMPQTLRRTTAGRWAVGTRVNLETSLRVGDEMGGHVLYGHIDGAAEVVNRREEGNAVLVTFAPPNTLMKFLAPQGSVAIDGVSLTVVDCGPATCSVSLIPLTRELTTLGTLAPGEFANIEVDMMMKYFETIIEARSKRST